MKNRKAFIVGLKTTKLLNREIKFLKKYKPWGVILFSRNIKCIDQCKILTESIKKIFNDKKYPILIDEEGGRVSRLGNIINTSMFSHRRILILLSQTRHIVPSVVMLVQYLTISSVTN